MLGKGFEMFTQLEPVRTRIIIICGIVGNARAVLIIIFANERGPL